MSETAKNTSLQARNPNTALQVQNDNHEIAPGIATLDKELVISYKQDPKFKELDVTNVIEEITKIIYNVFFEVGDNITPDADKEGIVARNIRDISRHFCYYSLKDIERCYEMGVRGEFTQKIQKFQGTCNVSVDMLYSWLREFKTYHGKVIVRQRMFESDKHNQLLLEDKTEQQRRHAQFLQSIIEEYNSFLPGETEYPTSFVIDAGNVIYNTLSKSKHFNLKTSTKEKLIKQALKANMAEHSTLYNKLSTNPIVSAIFNLKLPSGVDADETKRVIWLKQLPKSWKEWGGHIKNKQQELWVDEIFRHAKRLGLRVVIYDWKKSKLKIEDIINEIEKAQGAK